MVCEPAADAVTVDVHDVVPEAVDGVPPSTPTVTLAIPFLEDDLPLAVTGDATVDPAVGVEIDTDTGDWVEPLRAATAGDAAEAIVVTPTATAASPLLQHSHPNDRVFTRHSFAKNLRGMPLLDRRRRRKFGA